MHNRSPVRVSLYEGGSPVLPKAGVRSNYTRLSTRIRLLLKFVRLDERGDKLHRAFDCGLRWGIEPMFSDFKTRGFGIEDSHLQRTDRLGRLILVMALALYWAVSVGMWDKVNNATPGEKNRRTSGPATCSAA